MKVKVDKEEVKDMLVNYLKDKIGTNFRNDEVTIKSINEKGIAFEVKENDDYCPKCKSDKCRCNDKPLKSV